MERLSALELERIEELLAEDAPFWRLRQEVPRSRYAIYRAVKRLRCPPVPEPNRSPLRLSLPEREVGPVPSEDRGLGSAGGER